MKNSVLLRSNLILVIIFLFSSNLFSQNCKVEKELIQGTYTGNCKKGKANGKGKAVGIDSYEGMFKDGLPDGDGTYTWANGDSFSGKFVKGKRSGKGVLNYKRTNAPDSIIEGFWKDDAYYGKYEKPYIIHYASGAVVEVRVSHKEDIFNQVKFLIYSTSAGAPITTSNGGTITAIGKIAKLTVDNITVSPGGYVRMTQNTDHAKKSETILYNVRYPARMRLSIADQMLEIEFFEEGSYDVDVSINK